MALCLPTLLPRMIGVHAREVQKSIGLCKIHELHLAELGVDVCMTNHHCNGDVTTELRWKERPEHHRHNSSIYAERRSVFRELHNDHVHTHPDSPLLLNSAQLTTPCTVFMIIVAPCPSTQHTDRSQSRALHAMASKPCLTSPFDQQDRHLATISILQGLRQNENVPFVLLLYTAGRRLDFK